MSTLSTHVLDTASGRPAAGVPLRLFAGETLHFEGVTNPNGRCPDLAALALQPGRYRLAALGCTMFQGYLHSPPLPAHACLAYLRQAGAASS